MQHTNGLVHCQASTNYIGYLYRLLIYRLSYIVDDAKVSVPAALILLMSSSNLTRLTIISLAPENITEGN